MKHAAYIAILLSLFGLTQVYGLQCWRCDTLDDPNGCTGEKANKTGSHCSKHEDVCIKIVTKYQLSHNGPRNRTAEKQKSRCDDSTERPIVEYLSKICGSKKSFEQFAKIDKACVQETLGGGGTQLRCMCSGNLCNSATRPHASKSYFSLTILAAVIAFSARFDNYS